MEEKQPPPSATPHISSILSHYYLLSRTFSSNTPPARKQNKINSDAANRPTNQPTNHTESSFFFFTSHITYQQCITTMDASIIIPQLKNPAFGQSPKGPKVALGFRTGQGGDFPPIFSCFFPAKMAGGQGSLCSSGGLFVLFYFPPFFSCR